MQKASIDKINDWVKWFNWNASTMDNASLDRKVAFLAKALQGSLESIVILAEELRAVEYGRETKKIILPIGVRFNEPIRQKDAA